MPRNTTVFEWRESANTGDIGWIPKGYPEFDTTSGTFAGHDVMEHFPRHGGTLADEVMAFGAMIHVRAMGGWFRGDIYAPATSLGHDMGRFLNKLESGLLVMSNPGIVKPVDADGEHFIGDVMMETHHFANVDSPEYDNCEFDEDDPRLAWMQDWLRRGYAAAKRRWSHHPMELAQTFREIGRKFDRHRGYEEGDELHVFVDPRTLEVKVNMKEKTWHTQ